MGFNPELEELKSEQNSDQAEAFSDTSDPDQANDIDELLDPGFPVYFNCAIANKKHLLKVQSSYITSSWYYCIIAFLMSYYRTHLGITVSKVNF